MCKVKEATYERLQIHCMISFTGHSGKANLQGQSGHWWPVTRRGGRGMTTKEQAELFG